MILESIAKSIQFEQSDPIQSDFDFEFKYQCTTRPKNYFRRFDDPPVERRSWANSINPEAEEEKKGMSSKRKNRKPKKSTQKWKCSTRVIMLVSPKSDSESKSASEQQQQREQAEATEEEEEKRKGRRSGHSSY